MNSTPRLMRPVLFGAVVLALVSATSGCNWFKARSSYQQSVENRPLEVPPDLDLPDTSAATAMPSANTLAGTRSSATDIRLTDTAAVAYPKVGQALAGISGVTINGKAEALGSYDVTYQGLSFLVRVLDSSGGSRLIALSADGRMLSTGPAAELLAAVKGKL
jgi:hypothetical protein